MHISPVSSRGRRTLALALVLATGVLAAEALLPSERQPSALLVRAAIGAYQDYGSPVAASAGARCRYSPTCSHYAMEAVERRGTLVGLLQAGGRILRCGPWGGRGHDPVLASAVVQAGQETPEQKRQREEVERQIKEAWKQAAPEVGAAAGACAFGCVVWIIGGLIYLGLEVFMMIYAFKDAKARGDQNAAIWIVLIFFLHWIGFVIYMVARPKGDLSPCAHCKQSKLPALVKCPHCGADVAPAKG